MATPYMTTARRVCLRLLVHTHEHRQLIAYRRMRGMAVPWPDWRPAMRPLPPITTIFIIASFILGRQ